jgi:hypothetical protein
VIEPEWQLRRPLRLAGRVLEVNPARDGLPALLVMNDNRHRRGFAVGCQHEEHQRGERPAARDSFGNHDGSLIVRGTAMNNFDRT